MARFGPMGSDGGLGALRGRALLGAAVSRRRRGEQGMTLIEICIAIGVLGILMLPLASVFYTGQSTDSQNRQYGDAVALGDAALAQADAVTYSSLGFYKGQFTSAGVPGSGNCTGTVPGYNSQTAVVLQSTSANCQPPAGPGTSAVPTTETEQVGGVHFLLSIYVVWATGSGKCLVTQTTSYPCTEGEKQVYAVVTWNGRHQNQMKAVQSVLVYPGGLGPYNGPGQQSPVGVAQPPPNVSGLCIASSGQSGNPACAATSAVDDPTTQVALSWGDPGTPEPGWYEIVVQNSSSQPAIDTSGTDSSWDPSGAVVLGTMPANQSNGQPISVTLTNLSPATTYNFVIVAFSSDGSMWAVSTNSAAATTAGVVAPPPCTLTSLTIQQTGQTQSNTMVVKNGNGSSAGHLLNKVSITVAYSGNCTSSSSVTVQATGAATLGPYAMTFQASPQQFTYNSPTGLCPAAAFVTGQYTFTTKLGGALQTPQANVAVNSAGGSAGC